MEKFSSINTAFDHYRAHRAEATRLLTQTTPQQYPSQPIALPTAKAVFAGIARFDGDTALVELLKAKITPIL